MIIEFSGKLFIIKTLSIRLKSASPLIEIFNIKDLKIGKDIQLTW